MINARVPIHDQLSFTSLKVIQFPHPILIILTPVESDLLLWSWVIFLWVWRKPKRKITLTLEKKHETKLSIGF